MPNGKALQQSTLTFYALRFTLLLHGERHVELRLVPLEAQHTAFVGIIDLDGKRLDGLGQVVGLVAGRDPTPSSYLFGRRVFLALLGIAFLVKPGTPTLCWSSIGKAWKRTKRQF